MRELSIKLKANETMEWLAIEMLKKATKNICYFKVTRKVTCFKYYKQMVIYIHSVYFDMLHVYWGEIYYSLMWDIITD